MFSRIIISIETVAFFILATPFELAIGGGYVYGIKFACCLVLALSKTFRDSRTVPRSAIVIAIVAMSFLLSNLQNVSQRAILAFFLMSLGAYIGISRSSQWSNRLHQLVTYYMYIHVAGFIVGLAVFVATGTVLELHGMLFPGLSRAESVGLTARISGFHVEPGTYSQWMLLSVLLRSLIDKRIATPLNTLVALTALLTTSLWGLTGCGVFVAAVLIEFILQKGGVSRVRTSISICLLAFSFSLPMMLLPSGVLEDTKNYIELKSTLQTESGTDKALAYDEIRSQVYSSFLIGQPIEPGFCPRCSSPDDIGVWANGIYSFGLIPFALLAFSIVFSVYRKWGMAFLPMVVLMFLWKATFYDPFLWIIISYIISTNRSVLTGRMLRKSRFPWLYQRHSIVDQLNSSAILKRAL